MAVDRSSINTDFLPCIPRLIRYTRGPIPTRRSPPAHAPAGGSNMRSRARGLVLGSFGLTLGLAGCSGAGEVIARDGARPHADQVLADAPALLPPQPPASEPPKPSGAPVSRLQKPPAP